MDPVVGPFRGILCPACGRLDVVDLMSGSIGTAPFLFAPHTAVGDFISRWLRPGEPCPAAGARATGGGDESSSWVWSRLTDVPPLSEVAEAFELSDHGEWLPDGGHTRGRALATLRDIPGAPASSRRGPFTVRVA